MSLQSDALETQIYDHLFPSILSVPRTSLRKFADVTKLCAQVTREQALTQQRSPDNILLALVGNSSSALVGFKFFVLTW